ncbi:uncharacterized protein LOC129577548 isoform X3 [Sitodiplosis mosellana]|uniref:uncharacterized protein LOC129577548 isoform X3 n=1 Tax=Sitodiplosis mosellana TaxID=263140 RepID=UPI002443CF73|nr:uncharacterized protein LOC129577548 isoform X3 [Sitodiplosis mosellana]
MKRFHFPWRFSAMTCDILKRVNFTLYTHISARQRTDSTNTSKHTQLSRCTNNLKNILDFHAFVFKMQRIPLDKTQSMTKETKEKAMYQTCDLDEYLKSYAYDDDHISPEEFLQTREPLPEETIRTPEEFLEPLHPSEYAKDGDITRMLRNMPGILPAVVNFPNGYVQPKPLEQPDVIFNDRIPILLSEKFFKFRNDFVEETTDVSNCTDDGDDANNGNNSNGYNGKNAQNEMVNAKRQFWTVFTDTDFDELSAVPVNEMQRCTIADGEKSTVNKKSAQRYYTPYEIYMMKRGNKH